MLLKQKLFTVMCCMVAPLKKYLSEDIGILSRVSEIRMQAKMHSYIATEFSLKGITMICIYDQICDKGPSTHIQFYELGRP